MFTTCDCGKPDCKADNPDKAAHEFNPALERSAFSDAERQVIGWALTAIGTKLLENAELVKAALPTAEMKARFAWALPAIMVTQALSALNIEPNSDRVHELFAALTSHYNQHCKTSKQIEAEENAERQAFADQLLSRITGREAPAAN